jgi:hypothetical protein
MENHEEMENHVRTHYAFCGHIVTKNASQVKACIEEMLTGPQAWNFRWKVKYVIHGVGDVLPEKSFHGFKNKVTREFLTQGHLTEEEIAEFECAIYNSDGHLIKSANRELPFYCEDCMTVYDNYGQRQSSAVGIVMAWGDHIEDLLPNASDVISGHGFWIASRNHTTLPSTTNRRLFRRGQLSFGDPFEYAYRLR